MLDFIIGCYAIGFTYYIFTIEAKCWHGIEVDNEFFQTVCQKVCCAISSAETDSSAISTVLRGIELSGSAGLAMSHVREYLDDGSSSNKNNSVKMLDFSSIRINQQKLLGAGSTARVYLGEWNGRKCAIKLLYTVEITADEVCFISFLSIDCTQVLPISIFFFRGQIKRTCAEAALLHALQHTSENVVGLFGVALLPPSLCVVLEFCRFDNFT